VSGFGPPTRRLAAAALAATLALASGAAARADDGSTLPVSPGNDFLWSADGSTLIAFERDAARGLIAVRAFDGAEGAPRWELTGDRLGVFANATAAAAELAAVPAADGASLLLGQAGRWWLWRAADATLAAVPELDGGAEPRFAPDGSRVAFARQGDLWTYSPAGRSVRRLTADGEATRDGEVPPEVLRRSGGLTTTGFAWATDGLRLAFYRWSEGGPVRLAVLDVDDAEAREFELAAEGPGLPVGWTWRFDARAVAVLWLPAGEASLDLRLCHPERSYCRPLASRAWSARRDLQDDFRFLEDGFLWGSGSGAGARLSYYDPLGRERRSVLTEEVRRLGLVAVIEVTREAVVAIERPDEAGFVRLLLIDLRRGTAQEIASAPGGPPVAISGELRTWVRPGKSAKGTFDGHLLERLDGTALRRFE
jgi:dipeptidyl aminopeptidase/acylaminoacyl peptidase